MEDTAKSEDRLPERKITGGQKRGELPLAAEIETLKIFLIPMEAREKLALGSCSPTRNFHPGVDGFGKTPAG